MWIKWGRPPPVFTTSKPAGEFSHEFSDEFFLYEYDGTWRIGKDFNKPDCWAYTNQTNISRMITAPWFESGKTKNKREITVQISPSIHRDDFGKSDLLIKVGSAFPMVAVTLLLRAEF